MGILKNVTFVHAHNCRSSRHAEGGDAFVQTRAWTIPAGSDVVGVAGYGMAKLQEVPSTA
jgi:hypothetical protein